nr:MAG TPA: hypothetical protein [Crassvirales sp.]
MQPLSELMQISLLFVAQVNKVSISLGIKG